MPREADNGFGPPRAAVAAVWVAIIGLVVSVTSAFVHAYGDLAALDARVQELEHLVNANAQSIEQIELRLSPERK